MTIRNFNVIMIHISISRSDIVLRGLMNTNNQNNQYTENERDVLIDLIKRAREGSSDAITVLEQQYAPLILSQVSKFRTSDMNAQDVEDMRQEARVHFYNAVCHYDYDIREVEFGLYAKICIEHGLISHQRTYDRKKNQSTVSLDHVEQFMKSSDDPLRKIVEKERMAEYFSVIRETLSPYEYEIWSLYLQGLSPSKIAEKLGDGATAKSVSNAIYRIKRKLKERFSDRRP